MNFNVINTTLDYLDDVRVSIPKCKSDKESAPLRVQCLYHQLCLRYFFHEQLPPKLKYDKLEKRFVKAFRALGPFPMHTFLNHGHASHVHAAVCQYFSKTPSFWVKTLWNQKDQDGQLVWDYIAKRCHHLVLEIFLLQEHPKMRAQAATSVMFYLLKKWNLCQEPLTILQTLLKYGADPKAMGKDDRSPLYYAFQTGERNAVVLLLKAKASLLDIRLNFILDHLMILTASCAIMMLNLVPLSECIKNGMINHDAILNPKVINLSRQKLIHAIKENERKATVQKDEAELNVNALSELEKGAQAKSRRRLLHSILDEALKYNAAGRKQIFQLMGSLHVNPSLVISLIRKYQDSINPELILNIRANYFITVQQQFNKLVRFQ